MPNHAMFAIERLSDLDELVLRCRTEQSREYISEAVSCYRAGAYRATVVNTWIAIVFDLIDKIRELSVSGDKTAEALFKKFETYQQQIDKENKQGVKSALEFEREILTHVKDSLQFFDQQQFMDLSRLREDRHRCAHPSFQKIELPYRPSAEQARLHLRNAVLHVLSQPPVQGKAALAELKSLVSSQYFPHDTEKAKTQLRESALFKPTESLILGFVDQCVFSYFDDGQPLRFSPRIVAALNALLEMHRTTTEPRLAKQLNKVIRDVADDDFIGAALFVLVLDGAWDLLDQSSKDKINQCIQKGPADKIIAILQGASTREDLRLAVEKRIPELTIGQLSEAVTTYHLRHGIVKRAVELYTSVKSYSEANVVADKLILPLLGSLTREDISQIILSPKDKGADLPGSIGFMKFLTKVRQRKIFSTSEFNDLLRKAELTQFIERDTAGLAEDESKTVWNF